MRSIINGVEIFYSDSDKYVAVQVPEGEVIPAWMRVLSRFGVHVTPPVYETPSYAHPDDSAILWDVSPRMVEMAMKIASEDTTRDIEYLRRAETKARYKAEKGYSAVADAIENHCRTYLEEEGGEEIIEKIIQDHCGWSITRSLFPLRPLEIQ